MLDLVDELSPEFVQEAAYVIDTTCPVCYAEFLDPVDLLMHVNQVHTSAITPQTCQLCPASNAGVIEYAKHVRDAHLLDLRSCKYCSKVFLNGGKLKQHEVRHASNDNLFCCSQCNTLLPNVNLLEHHESKYHDNSKDGVVLSCMPHLSELLCLKAKLLLQCVGKKTLKCLMCEFSSSNLREYANHLETKKCETFVCSLCSSAFTSKKILVRHTRVAKKCLAVKISDEKTVMCPDCKKSVHVAAAESHFKACRALKCIDCEFVCKTVEQLSEHQAEKHPLDMNFRKCRYCTREFIGDYPMRKHVRRVHKSSFHLYKYKCTDCKAIFQHPQKLFAHFFSSHKTLLPFHCKICNKSFRIRKSFSIHIKLEHKSIGFVEFDEKYHVFFTANKSDNPFVPKCVLSQEELTAYDSETEDIDKTGEPSDTDLTNIETEDDKPKPKAKSKQVKTKKPKKTNKKDSVLIYSSDEEPLQELKKKAIKVRRSRKYKKSRGKIPQFMCVTCDKNCYTYQNYLNHINTHKENQELECVKCSQKFNSKNSLTEHMKEAHASSKLTETLKNLLKKKQTAPNEQTTNKDPFKVVLQKVKSVVTDVPATIKPVGNNLSVKNFIENFTPDITDLAPKETDPITSTVSIRPYLSPYHREPLIKLTKFVDVPTYEPVPLKMPQRFKQHDHFVKTKIRIRVVNPEPEVTPELDHNYTENYDDDTYYDRYVCLLHYH